MVRVIGCVVIERNIARESPTDPARGRMPAPPSLNLNAAQFAVLGIPGGEIIPEVRRPALDGASARRRWRNHAEYL